jgi:putative PIN family toxin of toxin-antitoxin system
MDRVVVDTNVLVSALLGKGNARRVLDIVFSGRVSFSLSTSILAEYESVLQRPKFSQYSEFAVLASSTLRSLQSIAQFVGPAISLRVCPDPDDDKFLDLAVAAQARYLVTGNKRHFPLGMYKGTQIVSPREFVSLFK